MRASTWAEPEFNAWDVAKLYAVMQEERLRGRYGENLLEASSPEADPTYYGDGAIRFLPGHRVNHAEAAVEEYVKKFEENLPPGAQFFVTKQTY